MIQQNWALIELDAAGVAVYFISDISGVFGQMSLNTGDRANASHPGNGYPRFTDKQQAESILNPPIPPFIHHPHPIGSIYSSVCFWKSL